MVLNSPYLDVSWRPHVCPHQDLAALAPESEHNSKALCHLLCPGSICSSSSRHVQRWEYCLWKRFTLPEQHQLLCDDSECFSWVTKFSSKELRDGSLFRAEWFSYIQRGKALCSCAVLEVRGWGGAFLCVADTNLVFIKTELGLRWQFSWITAHGSQRFA